MTQVEALKKKGKGKQTGEKADKKETPAPIPEGKSTVPEEKKDEEDAPAEAATASPPAEEDEPAPEDGSKTTKTGHGRQPSLSVQSRMRSTSFRRASGGYTPVSPTSAIASGKGPTNLPTLSPEGDAVTEIYRKQASRLEELERENKRLARELEAAETRWRKSEEELEELREGNVKVAELQARAEKADAKNEEITKLVRGGKDSAEPLYNR